MTREIHLRPDELARCLNINIRTVYRYVHSGKILAVKVGRQIRIPERELVRICQSMESAEAEAVSLKRNNAPVR